MADTRAIYLTDTPDASRALSPPRSRTPANHVRCGCCSDKYSPYCISRNRATATPIEATVRFILDRSVFNRWPYLPTNRSFTAQVCANTSSPVAHGPLNKTGECAPTSRQPMCNPHRRVYEIIFIS